MFIDGYNHFQLEIDDNNTMCAHPILTHTCNMHTAHILILSAQLVRKHYKTYYLILYLAGFRFHSDVLSSDSAENMISFLCSFLLPCVSEPRLTSTSEYVSKLVISSLKPGYKKKCFFLKKNKPAQLCSKYLYSLHVRPLKKGANASTQKKIQFLETKLPTTTN